VPNSIDVKRSLVDREHSELSILRQCELLGLKRSSYYYDGADVLQKDLWLMRLIDEQYLRTPFFGSRMMAEWLSRDLTERINRKRVQRLMRTMGIEAIYPKPRTTRRDAEHRVFPYLLRDLEITHKDQVWSADITYVPLRHGFMYLVAVMDWYTRYVVSWQLSNTLEGHFCISALEEALSISTPEIFNTDQGSQFTSKAFTSSLDDRGIAISMDGRGRALDNVFIERLWRTVKYEDIYLKDYETARRLKTGLGNYFRFYCDERPHSSLGYRTPAELYLGKE
jgi:putative transposase